MRIAILTMMVGCTNVYDLQNRAPFTAYDCAVSADGTWDGPEVFGYPDISEDCVNAILDDFKADDSLRLFDLTDSDDFDSWGTAQGSLVGGAWALLHYDWEIDHISLNDSIREVENELGEKPNGWTLYNWAAAQYKSSTVQHSDDFVAAYNPYRDQLRMDDPLPPLMAAAVLVHESKHAEGSSHFKCWDDGRKNCDRDWTGAYGASAAIFEAIETEDEMVLDYIETNLEWVSGRVNP